MGGYRSLIINHIIPKLGGVALTELSEKRIRAFYRRLSNAGLNDRSVWCVHLLLRRILDEACREELIPENPAWNISVRPGNEPKPNRLRSGQIKRYLEAAEELGYLPIFLLALERADLKHISFKNLRHTCAVRALEVGQDERKLSAMLGHTRTSVTQHRYREYLPQTERKKGVCRHCALSEEKMKQAADKLGQLFTI